jgi:hypothetical protein
MDLSIRKEFKGRSPSLSVFIYSRLAGYPRSWTYLRRTRGRNADERDYFWRLVTPGYWQDAARDLICRPTSSRRTIGRRRASGLRVWVDFLPYAAMRQRHTSPRAIIVRYALAIENMLKGIIVAMGQDPVGADGRIQRWLANHKLDELARRATVTGLNKDLLHQLTEFITAGKYPVGLEDGNDARAHGYFPDNVLAGVETVLPVLEERLAAVSCVRDKRTKVDLLSLCASRKKGKKRERKDF